MAEKKKTFEESITRLEEIVTRLERGESTLEESIALFEEGTKLSASCAKQLNRAEQKVLNGENYESIIVPIIDSTGMCVGVFEYKCTFSELYDLGNKLEGRILTAVVIAVLA